MTGAGARGISKSKRQLEESPGATGAERGDQRDVMMRDCRRLRGPVVSIRLTLNTHRTVNEVDTKRNEA